MIRGLSPTDWWRVYSWTVKPWRWPRQIGWRVVWWWQWRHALRTPCPDCGRLPSRHPQCPRWDDDVLVARFDWLEGHCPNCGARLCPDEVEAG